MTKPTKKAAQRSAAAEPASTASPTGMITVEIAVGPNPDGLRHQTAIQQQPDEAARDAAIAEIESEG